MYTNKFWSEKLLKLQTDHTWYLSFFLHRHNFLDKFFSTQKRVNRDKKFSTKQRKSPKSWFYNSLMRQNTINCAHNFSILQIFFRFLMWRAFSTWQSVTWRIFPHDNLSCGEFFHMTTCYVEKFLHIADFFSTGTARGARDKYQVCLNLNRNLRHQHKCFVMKWNYLDLVGLGQPYFQTKE